MLCGCWVCLWKGCVENSLCGLPLPAISWWLRKFHISTFLLVCQCPVKVCFCFWFERGRVEREILLPAKFQCDRKALRLHLGRDHRTHAQKLSLLCHSCQCFRSFFHCLIKPFIWQVFTSWYNFLFLGHENIALESKVLTSGSSKGAGVMGATSGN